MGNNCCVVSQPQSRKPQFASCPRYSAVNQSPIIGRFVPLGGPDEQVAQKQPETKWSNGGLYQAVAGASDGAIGHRNVASGTASKYIEPLKNSVESQCGDPVDGCPVQQSPTLVTESIKSEEQTQKGEVVLNRVSRSQEELDNPKGSHPSAGDGGQYKSLGSLRRREDKETSASPHHSSASALLGHPNRSIKEAKVEQSLTMFSSGRSAQVSTSQHLEKGSQSSVLSDPLREPENQPLTPVTNPSKEARRNSSSVSSCQKDRSLLSRCASSGTSSTKRASARLSHRLSAALESGLDSAVTESGTDSCAPECSTDSELRSPVTFKSRTSFRLVRDLEVPDPDVVQSKDLKQLVEAFVRDNSLMRKPCKEFLDRASYRRAKLEHHLSLVSTVKGVDVCSLSCASVTSTRTVNEQSTLDLQSTPPKSAFRLSAKKNLNFEKMSTSTGRLKSASSSRSDCAKAELFNLEDFLETASEGQKDGDAERSSSFDPSASAVGAGTRPDALDESFSSSVFRNGSPRKSGNSPRNSVSLPLSKEWDIDQDYGSDDRGLKKRDSPAKGEDKSFKEASYVNGWEHPLDGDSDRCGGMGKEDKENSPPNALGSSKFKKTAVNFGDSFDGADNETAFRSSRRSRSSVSSLKESSPLSKINTLNVIDNFPSFECEDQYGNNNNKERAYSTPKKKKNDAVSAFESPSCHALDDNFSAFNSCLNSSKVSDGSYKARSSFKNNSFSNDVADEDTFSKSDAYNDFSGGFDAVKSNDSEWPKLRGGGDDFKSGYQSSLDNADPDPVCSELSLFGEEDRGSTSRMNVSSSSQRSLRRPSPALGRPFATLSGMSPTYKKRNSFKFDEDPRFGCNTSRNSDNCQSDYDLQDNLALGNQAGNERYSPERGKRNRRVHTANDSQDFGNENLFGFPADDETLEDPFSTSGDQNASTDRTTKEDGEQQEHDEGPSLRLSKHVKISKKGISLGAMGCELSIGKNVELNIFGKKAATLV